jgi:phenylalanyl-tRNA synthetase beta subunit
LKKHRFRLNFAETSRTFTDEDADSAMDAAVRNLGAFAAELRD